MVERDIQHSARHERAHIHGNQGTFYFPSPRLRHTGEIKADIDLPDE